MYRSLNPWRRNVFLDCGGNNGSSVRKFRREFDSSLRFDIYTFEPNRAYESDYASFDRHTLIQSAVSDADGTAEFYLDREDGDGSTLFRDKLTKDTGGYGTLDIAHPELVTTVDLSRWIGDELRPSDYIVLKLDVEGAEYAVLEKMASDGTLDRIRHLFVEWHWRKIGISESQHIHALSLVTKRRIQVLEWDAMGY